MQKSSARETWELIKNKEFAYFIFMRFVIIFSLFIQTTTISYWMYSLTKNAMSLGLIGLAEVIPAFGFAFIAGYFVDKRIKRNVYRSCIFLYVINTAVMIAITSSWAGRQLSVHGLELAVYAIMFINGSIRAFIAPSSFSLLGLLVKKESISQAITWSSTSWMLGSVLGPLCGGLMMAYAGIQPTLELTLVLLALAFFAINQIKPQPPILKQDVGLIEGLRQGFRFVFKTEVILAVLSLDLFAVLFGGAEALLPVFCKDILKVGEVGYGWLRSAHGIGSICLLLLLAYIPLKEHVGYKLLACIFGFGLCMILFGLSTNFYLSFACLMIAGLFDGVSVVIRHSILQIHTPDELKGRVSSINMMFISSSNELGAFESGLTAKYMGAVRAVVFGGIMTLLVVGGTYIKAPSLRTLRMMKEEPEA